MGYSTTGSGVTHLSNDCPAREDAVGDRAGGDMSDDDTSTLVDVKGTSVAHYLAPRGRSIPTPDQHADTTRALRTGAESLSQRTPSGPSRSWAVDSFVRRRLK